MIRPFTLMTMMLAMLSGAYLFAVKHRAQVLDDQLSAVVNQTQLDEQRIRVLQAQWSLEIDPTRLSRLSHQFTNLQPMQPAQLIALNDLPGALPAPGSAAPASNPAAPMPAMPVASAPVAPPPIARAAPAASLPLPPPAPAAPVQLAVAENHPASARMQHVAARAPRHEAHAHIAADQFAENLPPPRPVRPFYPIGAQVMPVRATAPVPADNGSALAMGSDLAPPQPLTEGANN
jgi:hypothetical protein